LPPPSRPTASFCSSWTEEANSTTRRFLLPLAPAFFASGRLALPRAAVAAVELTAWFVHQIGLLYAVEKRLREKKAGPRLRPVCGQGQPLNWLGCEAADQLHWFGVTDTNPLCQRRWIWRIECKFPFLRKI
jgi:hypothetical protein